MLRAGAGALLSVILALPAAAHLQFFPGRLLDLLQRSERVVIAAVDHVEGDLASSRRLWAVRVDGNEGEPPAPVRLTADARLALEPGKRYAFFVKGKDANLECVHPSGVVFPADAGGSEYVDLDRQVRPLLLHGPPRRIVDALIPRLRSPVRELRYHVALALSDAAHGEHPLDAEQQAQLREVAESPDFDAAIRPLIAPLLVPAPTPAAR